MLAEAPQSLVTISAGMNAGAALSPLIALWNWGKICSAQDLQVVLTRIIGVLLRTTAANFFGALLYRDREAVRDVAIISMWL